MKKSHSFALMAAVVLTSLTGLTACSSSSDVEEVNNPNVVYDDQGTAGVKPEFVISIPRTVVGTRMSNEVTQNEGTVAQFRGIDNIRLIPFAEKPYSSVQKLSDIMRLSAVKALSSPGAVNYKVYSDQFVPVGTKYFLFYGKAIDRDAEVAITSMDDKFYYGILNAKGLENSEFKIPADLIFSLDQINSSADAQASNAVGNNIVALLTELANFSLSGEAAPNNKWSTSDNILMARLYKNFLGITTGSSASLSFILSKVYFTLEHIPSSNSAYKLANAIRGRIEEVCASGPINGEPVTLKSAYAGYPANIGLPDGAARVRWNKPSNSFVDISANYTKNFKTKITDYVYPPALWYYVNSPLKAAAEKKSDKYDNAGNWEGVINSVYNGAADEVDASTMSVALSSPAQYGVGRLETKVAMEDGPLYDADGNEVVVGSGYTLTGILIGGQNSVGYNFEKVGNENMTIYDRNMTSNSIIAKPGETTATANQTLALETVADQTVHAALELVNGGEQFSGFDGVIPKGGKFYLAVKLDPTTATNYAQGSLDKIFKQDHVTKLTVTIKKGSTIVDRDIDGPDGTPDVYIKDENGVPTGVDTDGDGVKDPYDIDGDGKNDEFITDPDHGGPGWDTDGDGEVDIPVVPDPETGEYPDSPANPEGLGGATNGIPDLTSPGIELGTSVNLEWQEGLILNPNI